MNHFRIDKPCAGKPKPKRVGRKGHSGPMRRFLAGLLTMCFTCFGFAAASPDVYENGFDDNTTQTQNVLSPQLEQDHSIHQSSDTDWGICIVDTGGDFSTHQLQFYNTVIPPGSFLTVTLYEYGIDDEPGQQVFLNTSTPSTTLSWADFGTTAVYYSVTCTGSVDPSTSYTVQYSAPAAPNTVLISTVTSSRVSLQWDTDGFSGQAGFNVTRRTGFSGNYVQINPSLIPPPVTPGLCPGPGCMTYDDNTVAPSTTYFYKIMGTYENDSPPAAQFGTTTYTRTPAEPVTSPVTLSGFSAE